MADKPIIRLVDERLSSDKILIIVPEIKKYWVSRSLFYILKVL